MRLGRTRRGKEDATGAKLDLDRSDLSHVAEVLAWPVSAITSIRADVLDRYNGKPLASPQLSRLREFGLMKHDENWTTLGEAIAFLLIHEYWQEGDELQQHLAQHARELSGAVLDVGCSTGWTLRQAREASYRIGVDIDEQALALGYRLAEVEAQEIEFRRASAHCLPFEDASFDCVICRNAITYTHQERTLHEIARVIKPGGIFLLRFENFRYDISLLRLHASLKAFCCRMRDLIFGITHAVSGWQLRGRFAPGRTFGSLRQIHRYLRASGMDLLQIEDSLKCPRFGGRSTQTFVLAAKPAAAGLA